MTTKQLIKKLTKQEKQLKRMIEYNSLYRIKRQTLKIFLQTSIAFDYAFPFILSGFIIAYTSKNALKNPFELDKIKEKANMEVIDTSSGIHFEKTSYDYEYKNQTIEYSEGWKINEYGLFERTSILYEIDNISNIDELLSLSQEEIENKYIKKNIKKIQKNNLDLEDEIYLEDVIVITNVLKSDQIFLERKQTQDENLDDIFLYIFSVLGNGILLAKVKKIIFKTHIKDYLKEKIPVTKQYTKEELEEIKQILIQNQKNLQLISEDKVKSYPLRK